MPPDVRLLVPISKLLGGIVPADWISAIGDAFDWIAIDPRGSTFQWEPTGLSLRQRLVILQQVSFDLPLISGATLRLGRPGGFPEATLAFATEPRPWIELGTVPITLHLPPDIAKAYRQLPSGEWRTVEESGDSRGYDLTWETGVRATFDGDVDFRVPQITGVPPAMVADSGFILEIERFAIVTGALPPDLPAAMVARLPVGFKGVLVDAELHYWKPGNDFSPTFAIQDGAIGDGGFSGTVAFGDPDNADREYDAETLGGDDLPPQLLRCDLGGAKVILQLFSLTFAQSLPTGSRIVGYMFIPLGEKWVRINASIGGPEGDFLIEASGAAGEELIEIDIDWLEILVDSLAYIFRDEKHYVQITGSARPKIGDFDWPKLTVDDLLIGSDGSVEMKGGWIDVPESFSLDFQAFKIELNRIGFGTEGEDGEQQRSWVGVSGGIRLLEGIPLSASVQGLKVSWLPPPAPDPDIQVSIEGIAVSLEIPGTLKIEGSVSYRELPQPPDELPADEELPAEGEASLYFGHIFRGGINIEITCLNMAVAGELMIGELTSYHWEGRTRIDDQSFVALFIMLSVELPTAIPLGATGAGLYGIKGLFGMNVAPDRRLDEEGEPENWYLWYKNPREGLQGTAYTVTKAVKWAPRFDNFAFGAGLKIGTVYDDGFTINAGVLAAILIPGPVVMIEGRANLLKQRTGEGQGMEGALYALIVFDGLAETFQMNIDVNFAMEDVITVAGGLEAFFDFNDSSRWFIHIGKKEPLDGSKRIRADILSIITAKAYFMIEPIGIQFGASVGVELEYEYGPVEIKLIIRLAFDLAVFWKQPQITGAIELYIELSLKILGVGLGLLLQCGLDASAPEPWFLHGIARAALTLPFPLPSFDVQVEFTWGQTGPPAVVDLLKGAAMVSPKQTGAAWALPGAATIAELPPENEWPLVPVDATPSLTLGKPLSSISLRKDEDERSFVFVEDGPTEGVFFGYELRDVELKVKTPAGWVTQIARDTPTAPQLRLRPDPYALEPQVELWWYAPLDTYDPQSRRNYVDSCDGAIGPERRCVDWLDVALDTRYPSIFAREGLTFTTDIRQTGTIKALAPPPTTPGAPDRGLEVRGVRIRFLEPVGAVEIRLAAGGVSLAGFRSGNPVSLTESTPQPGVRSFSVAGSGLDTLHVTSLGALDQSVLPIILSICWMTVRESTIAAGRGSGGNRTALRSNLVLEPNRSYVLTATGVRNERHTGEATATLAEPQMLVWGFHTGGLPGTDYTRHDVTTPAPCDFADGPLNQVATYVARTVPRHGTPLFYRGYEVLVELADPYAVNMLAPVLSMRILDRNGKQVVPPPSWRRLTGDLPFLTPGLIAMLSAEREEACEGTRVPWTQQLLDRYIAAPLPDDTRPERMVRVELVAALPYGPQTVFGFDLTTSRFRDATEHLASGLPRLNGAPPPPRGAQGLRPLGRTGAPPLDWIPDVADKLATRAGLRETLRAAHVFGPHDAGMSVDEARAAIATATTELNALCGAVYERLDRGGGGTYAGVHELFVGAGLGQRPLPPAAIETLAIETGAGFFILLESPEPLDWIRLSVRREGSGERLPVVWNGDGTRAFLFDLGPTHLFTSAPVLRLSYDCGGPLAPDLDPLYRPGAPTPVEETVTWELIQL